MQYNDNFLQASSHDYIISTLNLHGTLGETRMTQGNSTKTQDYNTTYAHQICTLDPSIGSYLGGGGFSHERCQHHAIHNPFGVKP